MLEIHFYIVKRNIMPLLTLPDEYIIIYFVKKLTERGLYFENGCPQYKYDRWFIMG